MRILNIVVAVGITALAVKSCNYELPYLLRDALEESTGETTKTKKKLQSVQESYIEQNRNLTSILEDISELSCDKTVLELNLEGGSRRLGQAEEIKERIRLIRERIDRLDKEAERARELDKNLALSAKTIKKLRITLDNQNAEIDRLLNVISDKNATIGQQSSVISVQRDTISGQRNKISDQMQTITRQKDELKRSLDCQTEMIYRAGCEFERLADEGDLTLTVSGRKDKEKVRNYKKSIYEKAGEFYRQASNMGHAEAKGKCVVITYKINSL